MRIRRSDHIYKRIFFCNRYTDRLNYLALFTMSISRLYSFNAINISKTTCITDEANDVCPHNL